MKRVRYPQSWFAGYLILVFFLHINAILKNEDPLGDTQTDPISYDQKMEQEKDGVKAAATPKIIYYGGQGFLTKSSLTKNEKETAALTASKKKEDFNWSDWWEEEPAAESKAAEKTDEPDILLDAPEASPVNEDQEEAADLNQFETDEPAAAGDDWW